MHRMDKKEGETRGHGQLGNGGPNKANWQKEEGTAIREKEEERDDKGRSKYSTKVNLSW
jgi:hypothetical protein